MKKLFKWAAAAVAVIVLALVVFILFGLDPLIRSRVEQSGAHATGETTTLAGANLSLLGGSLALTDLDIANPTGYKAPQFLTMKNCNIKVQTGSLMGSTVMVDEITIDGLELTLEQNGIKNNLAEILDVIHKQTSAGSSGPQDASKPAAPGKQLKITVLRLTGTKVHVKAVIEMTLDLGPIELQDPTNPDGRPMKIADVFGKVLIRVAQQISENPQLPGNFKDGLKNVTQLFGAPPKNVKDLEDKAKELQDLFKKK